jgi:hypothetical protein
MQALHEWRDALGLLSVAMAIVAAIIYVVQTIHGEVRPHPLSWFLFGVLSATGYWVQRDEGAHQGSWTLLTMTIICFVFVVASLARGERNFSRQEWAFAVAAGAVFVIYFFTKQANLAAALNTVIDALGYGPTFVRGWTYPRKDSVTSFALNSAKFVPSLMAMDPISFATSFYPATLLVLNAAVAIMLAMRRQAVA